MKSVAEPRFDIDLPYGQQGELQVGTYLEWIAGGNGRVEVKRKRRTDLQFYVETSCDKGRRGQYQPSGIHATEADAWAFVVADTGITVIVPTDLLKATLLHRSVRAKAEDDGECPTQGLLVHFAAILDAASGGAA